jgi:hypothetical protein
VALQDPNLAERLRIERAATAESILAKNTAPSERLNREILE